MLSITFQASLAVLIVILLGAAMRWRNWLTASADKPLTDITMNVLYPAATFCSIRGNENLKDPLFVLWVILVGWITIAVGMIAAKFFLALFPRLCGTESDAEKRTFVLCNCLFNYGFLPIPLCLLLFGKQTQGVLFVFNVGTVIGMWTVAVAVLSKDALRQSFHQLYSAPMIGVYLAILFNYLPCADRLPECIETSLKWLNDSMIPLSLVLVGGIMYDEFRAKDRSFAWLKSVKIINSAVFIRMILVPALFILGAKYFIADADLQRVIIVQAAMPTAIMSLVWARQFNGSPATALRCVIVTNLLAILTTLIWIPVGRHFIGV